MVLAVVVIAGVILMTMVGELVSVVVLVLVLVVLVAVAFLSAYRGPNSTYANLKTSRRRGYRDKGKRVC